jgi:prepilin-type N-terminal cleavage/methylation domain-containing protein/prepilin-type processing-associated H-X9-DG protein
MNRRITRGFTLVELLVVIGIIALLISILLPALNKARDEANTVVCASNLRQIGQGIAQYVEENHGVFPPSNYYNGFGVDPVAGQFPTTPVYGYIHWSALLFGRMNNFNMIQNTDVAYQSAQGWKVFQCPALEDGGLPPTNTYPNNHEDGLSNESPSWAADYQAPRLAYTLNEALCPRSYLTVGFQGCLRAYQFVPATRVRYPAQVILGTELWGIQAAAETASKLGGATPVSNSRRPVSGIAAYGTFTADQAYLAPYSLPYQWAQASDLTPDSESLLVNSPPSPFPGNSTLDYVGRNHGGPKRLGAIAGAPGSWDLRKSNFLYVDGHVETKHITQTVYPVNQWTYGADFYSLDRTY